MITVFVWLMLAVAFSYYLVNFNTFASTYASLSGFFAAMFFLYLSALVLFLGGEFNRVLQIHRYRRLAAKLMRSSAMSEVLSASLLAARQAT